MSGQGSTRNAALLFRAWHRTWDINTLVHRDGKRPTMTQVSCAQVMCFELLLKLEEQGWPESVLATREEAIPGIGTPDHKTFAKATALLETTGLWRCELVNGQAPRWYCNYEAFDKLGQTHAGVAR